MGDKVGTDIPRLGRGDEGFDGHITDLVFNKLAFGRTPDIVASPRSEAEVVEVVRAARRDGHKVAVLSGGHSWCGAPVRDSGVLIDLSALDHVAIDPDARVVRVGPAARGGEVIAAVAAHGLAYPTGHCGTPGSGGYLLGGGIGLNSGHWRPACFSVRSVRVVTAAGELVVASESENRELLWLARGSGPAFPGVVTEFEVELQDRPADTRVSSWVFAYEDLPAVARWVSKASASLPSTVEVFTAAGGPERHEHLPSEGFPDFVVSVIAMAYTDSLEEARQALGPLDEGPGPQPLAHSSFESVPFEELSTAFDAEYPEDHRYLADAFWTDQDVEGAMVPLQEAFLRAPSGMNNFVALMMGNGSPLGLSPDDAAFSMDERTLVMAYALWKDPAADEANRSWMAGMSEILEPISTGAFISEADHQAYPSRLPRSFTPAGWERVRSLRAQWDPEDLFHLPGRDA
jgi:FAD/FMN-containing dehydrogenase